MRPSALYIKADDKHSANAFANGIRSPSVYFVAAFTRRGTTRSVITSLIADFITVLLLAPTLGAVLGLSEMLQALAFAFQRCVGTAVMFLVALGRDAE